MGLDTYKHYFNPRLEAIDLFEPLLNLADRFSCTMEMATYLTMLSVGGPKRFFRWYCDATSWKLTGINTIPIAFKDSFLQCNDDLELALLLMRTWFQSGSTYEERERQLKAWQINHNALIYAVEHKRDHLLADRFYEKSDEEFIRPVDLLLIPKIRLLLAYYLVKIERLRKKQEKGLAVKGSIYRTGDAIHPSFHQDSVLYGRQNRDIKSFVYFFPDQERVSGQIMAQQIVLISSDWLAWLLETERDEYDLAWFIAKTIRYNDRVQLPEQPDIILPRTQKDHGQRRWGKQDIFLGQNISNMIKQFAIGDLRNDESISIEPYYNSNGKGGKRNGRSGICGIAEPMVSEKLADLRVGMIYPGIIKDFIMLPGSFQIRVNLPNGLTGILYESDIWGQCNIVSDTTSMYIDEFIRVGKTLRVRVKFINKQTGYIELDARLPGLNPLEQLRGILEVEGVIEQVGESPQPFILVRIHSRIKPVPCRLHNSNGTDIRERYKVGDTVTCLIKNLHPEKEKIQLELIEQNLPHLSTEQSE